MELEAPHFSNLFECVLGYITLCSTSANNTSTPVPEAPHIQAIVTKVKREHEHLERSWAQETSDTDVVLLNLTVAIVETPTEIPAVLLLPRF